MAFKVTPFLMFQGSADEAIRLYVSVFRDSEVKSMQRYEPGESGPEGGVKRAHFALAGQEIICIDSAVAHAFSFTAATSLFVECEDDAEFDLAFRELSVGGSVPMPPNNYGFSRKFSWVNDRYGVSWQLNLK